MDQNFPWFQASLSPALEKKFSKIYKEYNTQRQAHASAARPSNSRTAVVKISADILALMLDGRERTISDILYIITMPHRMCVLAVRHLIEQNHLICSSSSGIPIYQHVSQKLPGHDEPTPISLSYSRAAYLDVMHVWITTADVAQKMGRTRNATHQALTLLLRDRLVEKKRVGNVNKWKVIDHAVF